MSTFIIHNSEVTWLLRFTFPSLKWVRTIGRRVIMRCRENSHLSAVTWASIEPGDICNITRSYSVPRQDISPTTSGKSRLSIPRWLLQCPAHNGLNSQGQTSQRSVSIGHGCLQSIDMSSTPTKSRGYQLKDIRKKNRWTNAVGK